MADLKHKISGKFLLKNRYKNFGPCIRKILVTGFRGINNLNLEIDYPITAISGLNGAGKSTLGQIASCAYKKPTTTKNYKRQYIKDFFPVSIADPAPFSDKAKAIYYYETDDPEKPQELTISRQKSEWSGYKRQPERHCYYIGFTVYIPKVERRDMSVYGGRDLKLTIKREIDRDIVIKMAKIIGHKYDDVNFQGVSHRSRKSELGIASRLGNSYSENNMGFGEGRVLYTVDKLETSPEQSLFILEEPETSLHENAQYEFAKYLIDVVNRRHHQIILSTHSSIILNALPSSARKLLIRTEQGVCIKDKISSNHIRSILSAGQQKALHVCVEDVFAKILLTEILRKKSRELVKSIAIHAIGDKDAVREAKNVLCEAGINAIAVRDADVGESQVEKLFSFPGTTPPEFEVFTRPIVIEAIKEKYDVDIVWLFQKDEITDHHQYCKVIAKEADCTEEVIRCFAIEKYIDDIDKDCESLISNIEKSI